MLREKYNKEESALNHELAKMTNHATLSQLNDMISDTETEHYSSANSHVDETDHAAMGKTSTEEVDLDEIVRSNLIKNDWVIVESKHSALNLQPPKSGIDTDTGSWQSIEVQGNGVFKADSYRINSVRSSTEDRVDTPDSVNTLKLVEENVSQDSAPGLQSDPSSANGINNNSEEGVPESGYYEDEEDGAVFDFLAKKRDKIPLPSFEDDESDQKDVDIDDISCHGDRSCSSPTFRSEITFNCTWASGGLFDDEVSAYDNLGEKRVGRDSEKPVYMFIPQTQDSSAKIGDE